MLTISVDSEKAYIESGGVIVSDAVNVPTVKFILSEFWNDFTVTAQFEGSSKTVGLANIASDVEYYIPWECITDAGELKIVVFGTAGDKRATVEYAVAHVADSGWATASEPQEPTPTVYEQYVNTVSEFASQAQVAAEKATFESNISQTAASTAVVADVSAREYSEAASQDCAEANEHAQTASAAAEQASTCAESATQARDTALTAATKAEEAVIKLAMPFTESGAQVICHPLESSELSVVADISAAKAASGTPSPDNIIALNGFETVRLNICAQNDADSKDITVELGQTVYAGNIDFKTGILTVNSKMYTCTESTPWYAADTTSSYNKLDSRKRYSLALSDIDVVKDAYKTDKRIMCSHVPTTWASNTWNNTDGISAGANEKLIYVYCDAYSTDATAFKTMMVGAQIIYPLAQPYTVELTAQQVIALAGANTISANCGNVTVSGVQEPAWTLQTLLERVAALENAAT